MHIEFVMYAVYNKVPWTVHGRQTAKKCSQIFMAKKKIDF